MKDDKLCVNSTLFYYSGNKFINKKLGHRLISLDGKDDLIFIAKNKILYGIGEFINVERLENNEFIHNGTGEFLVVNDKRMIDAKIESVLENTKYKDMLSSNRAVKERKSIEGMTIKELREWCGDNYSRQAAFRSYLRRLF